MAYTNIYVIPDQSNYKGGDLYDRYGNLEYFADVTALEDKTLGGVDMEIPVKAHSRKPYMQAKSSISVPAQTRYTVAGVRQTKGGIPGVTVTLADDQEKRQFQYTGTMSALYTWLETTAKVDFFMYGPTGTPYDKILAAAEGAALKAG